MSYDKMKTIKKYYINNGVIVETDEFQLYKNKVYSLTKKVKNELLNSWY
jgi:hypothetical protein